MVMELAMMPGGFFIGVSVSWEDESDGGRCLWWVTQDGQCSWRPPASSDQIVPDQYPNRLTYCQ